VHIRIKVGNVQMVYCFFSNNCVTLGVCRVHLDRSGNVFLPVLPFEIANVTKNEDPILHSSVFIVQFHIN